MDPNRLIAYTSIVNFIDTYAGSEVCNNWYQWIRWVLLIAVSAYFGIIGYQVSEYRGNMCDVFRNLCITAWCRHYTTQYIENVNVCQHVLEYLHIHHNPMVLICIRLEINIEKITNRS